jgi:hypothetical protein
MSVKLNVHVDGNDVWLILDEEQLVVMLAPAEAASLGHSLIRAADDIFDDDEEWVAA